MQLELGQAGSEASPKPWMGTAPSQGKGDWAGTQRDPGQPLESDALVGLYSLPRGNGVLHDQAKGIEITHLNLCNQWSLGEKYFSLALLLYIGLFLRHPNFAKCLASKESQGKDSVCLDDLKKDHRQENKGCFAGCNFTMLEGCFILLKSNPDQDILLWNLTHSSKALSKPHTYWERQRRWFYNILPDHNIVLSGWLCIIATFVYDVCKEAKGQGDKSRAEVGTPTRTFNWHSNKLKSKQNCPCLYKQLDCTLWEDNGMKLCPYKVTLIFYLSNKKKHRREVGGCWREKNPSVKAREMENKV